MRRPTFSQIMAGLIVIEKIHSTLSEMLPSYSSWAENFSRRIQKKLGLSQSLYDRIIGFLGTDKIMEDEISTDHAIQDQHFWIFLHDNITPVKILSPKETEEDVSLNRLLDLDQITALTETDLESFLINTCIDQPSCVETEESMAGLMPYAVVFGYYKETPLVCQIRTDDEDDLEMIVDFIFRQEDKEKFRQFKKRLEEYLVDNSPLKNWVVSCEENEFNDVDFFFDEELCRKLRFDKYKFDIELYNDDVKNLIQRDIKNFIKKQNQFCKNGFDGRRAYLLEGPPGTGKSDIIKSIISIVPKTFTTIVLNDKNIYQLRALKRMNFLFPALVIIEDIDLLVTEKRKWQVLLNFLDGLHAPDRIITIMTSNDKDSLISSITNRPGRIDRIINVGPGTKQQRIAQLHSLTKITQLPKNLSIETVADLTNGYTVAELREIIRRAVIYTESNGNKISEEAIKTVLDEFAKQKQNNTKIPNTIGQPNEEIEIDPETEDFIIPDFLPAVKRKKKI